MIEIDLGDLVRRGVAVIVATSDEAMRPELGRAWGPDLSADRGQLTICVEAPPGSAMARNLAVGAPVAATITRLTSAATVTLRGPVVAVAEPDPDRVDAVAGHVEAFVAEMAAVGAAESIARGLVGPHLLCVTIEVAEQVTETPGTGVGRSR